MARKSRASNTTYVNGLLLLITGSGVGWLIGLSLSPVLHVILGTVIALVAGVVGSLVGLQSASKDGDAEDGSDAGSRPSRLGQNVAHINPLPLAMMMVGLAVGSPLGIYARANDLFGPDPQKFARKWAGTGLDDKALQQRLFDRLYPPGASEGEPAPEPGPEPSGRSDAPPEGGAPDNAKRAGAADEPQTPKPSAASKVKTPKKSPGPPGTGGGLNPAQFAAGLYAVTAEDCQFLAGKGGEELRTRLVALNKPDITVAARGCANDACLAAIREKVCPRR